MPVSSLPPELWTRIFLHLDGKSLSSISEVCTTFHALSTHESLFHNHLSTDGMLEKTPAAQQYRRLQALHHRPNTQVSVFSSARTEPFAVVNDVLVLCDFGNSRMVCFPHGLCVDLDAFNEDDVPIPLYLTFPKGKMGHVVLPGDNLGFMHDRSPTRFAAMNVMTGEVLGYPVYGEVFPEKEIAEGKEFIAAGNNAEWVAYYVSDTRIAFVDWRSGKVVNVIDVEGDVRFVMGECLEIMGSSLVGLVHEQECGISKEVTVKGFDGVKTQFRVEREQTVHAVLRSVDKKTHVLITSTIESECEKMRFCACWKENGRERCWSGDLKMPSLPELRENGRLLMCRCGPYSLSEFTSLHVPLQEQAIALSSCQVTQLFIELTDYGSVIPSTISRTRCWEQPIWIRRTVDGGFALIVDRADNTHPLVLVKYVEGVNNAPQTVMEWSLWGIIRIHVVADHYVVLQKRDGNLIVLHFDRFCEGATGIYACPGAVKEEEDSVGMS